MKLTTKLLFTALPVAGIVAIFDPAAGAFWAILIGVLLFLKGAAKFFHEIEMENLNRDKQRILDSGGTETEANIYASLERQRRNAWAQTAAQMKR